MKKLFLCVLCVLCGESFGQQQPGQPGSTDLVATSLQFLLANPPSPIPLASISVQRLDNPGSSTYCYWVVARYTIGNAQPAGPFCITNGANTLVSGNVVNWSTATGATAFDVLRTSTTTPPSGACGCAVATNVSGTTATDTGTLSSYTVTTFGADVTFHQVNVQCGPGLSGLQLVADGGNTPALTATSDGVLHQGGCTGTPITGGGVPGAPNLSVQYNNAGTFGGIPNLTWDATDDRLLVTGDPSWHFDLFGTPSGSSCSLRTSSINCTDIGGSAGNIIGETALGPGTSNFPFVIAGETNGDGQAKNKVTALNVVTTVNASDTLTQAIGIDLQTQFDNTIGGSDGIACETGVAGGGSGSNPTATSACFHAKNQGTAPNTYALLVDGGKSSFTGIETGIRAIGANVNQTINDFTITCDATAGNVTVTGLASPPSGMIFVLKKLDSTANTCTFAGNGNPIDGSSSFPLSQQFAAVVLHYDSLHSVWDVIAQGVNNTSTVINGVTCTIGGSCTVTAAPSGPAGGDLSGTYPNPSVTGISGPARISTVRETCGQATHYSGADTAIVLSAGWGAGAAVSNANGCDEALSFSVLASGLGILANPTITITFKDGSFNANFPITIAARNDLSLPATLITWSDTQTTLTINFNGTPVTGTNYNFFTITRGIGTP